MYLFATKPRAEAPTTVLVLENDFFTASVITHHLLAASEPFTVLTLHGRSLSQTVQQTRYQSLSLAACRPLQLRTSGRRTVPNNLLFPFHCPLTFRRVLFTGKQFTTIANY